MATVTVVKDKIGGHLEVYYSFSANVSARTWSLYSELRLVVPSGATYGAWSATGAHGGDLVGNGIGSLRAGTYTLDSYSTSGNYNSNGDAPSVNISWAFNVRSSWAGYWDNYGSITATGSPIGPDGTPPTGLTATLGTVGPDWAEITVSISSYGSPSTSASRYIEAATLGSSSYGNPYKYKTKKAVNTNTFTIDNSGSGNLTIVPNTQYRYGGYASNTVRSVSTVAGQFTTLPATPVITATDQGHGQIDFAVTHATEGSAKTVTEEYSTDGGTTWVAITGGAFTLTLSAQTAVKVRRTSAAGASSASITVVPQFDVGIYGSANNKTVAIRKGYAPFQTTDRGISGIESVSGNEYANIPEGNYGILMMAMLDNNDIKDKVALRATYQYMDISLWKNPLGQYSMTWHLRENAPTGSSPQVNLTLAQTTSFSDFCNMAAQYGVNILPSFESVAPVLTEFYLDISATFENRIVSKKIGKVYASVNGKTTLVFEDVS